MFALIHQAGVDNRDARLTLMSEITHRSISSTNDLTEIEVQAIVDVLDYWKRLGELRDRATKMIGRQQ